MQLYVLPQHATGSVIQPNYDAQREIAIQYTTPTTQYSPMMIQSRSASIDNSIDNPSQSQVQIEVANNNEDNQIVYHTTDGQPISSNADSNNAGQYNIPIITSHNSMTSQPISSYYSNSSPVNSVAGGTTIAHTFISPAGTENNCISNTVQSGTVTNENGSEQFLEQNPSSGKNNHSAENMTQQHDAANAEVAAEDTSSPNNITAEVNN